MSDFFFSLEPQNILEAIEQIGVRSTGRCFALNSLENRVYEAEMEDGSKIVGKFYRPGRWTKEAILEEHQFLADLAKAEIPVVEPLKLKNGSTLDKISGGIFFSLFPKVRGRAPEELQDDQVQQVGRLIARLHNVGAARSASHRLHLNPKTYGRAPLDFLLAGEFIPVELAPHYRKVVEDILDVITPWFDGVETHRIHGDCHLGNLLYNSDGPFFLDFDDMVVGPAVQDFWLLVPGQDEDALKKRQIFLDGYSEMREFDHATMRLIEPLRALRIVHYSAWVAKRWKDPAFPRVFSEFNTHRYWDLEIRDLKKQLAIITGAEDRTLGAFQDDDTKKEKLKPAYTGGNDALPTKIVYLDDDDDSGGNSIQ